MNNRYQSQLKLYNFGQVAQDKLATAHVLVVGAGGLAAALLSYLAAAGIGNIDIMDFDEVECTNLNRQFLYTPDDIGEAKAKIAAARIAAQNPDINISFRLERLDNSNALEYIASVDLVIDACDNFATRYIINDACLLCRKTWIYGAISGYMGQVAVFRSDSADNSSSCNYRDLYAVVPRDAVDCNETGVIGAVTGIIGSMQAMEAIKYLSNIAQIATNTLITYDALTNMSYCVEIKPNRVAYTHILPRNEAEFLAFDYFTHCRKKPDKDTIIIFSSDLEAAELSGKKIVIIDLREEEEVAENTIIIDYLNYFDCEAMPFSYWSVQTTLPDADMLVFYCPQGRRSKTIVRIMKEKYPNRLLYALQVREG